MGRGKKLRSRRAGTSSQDGQDGGDGKGGGWGGNGGTGGMGGMEGMEEMGDKQGTHGGVGGMERVGKGGIEGGRFCDPIFYFHVDFRCGYSAEMGNLLTSSDNDVTFLATCGAESRSRYCGVLGKHGFPI